MTINVQVKSDQYQIDVVGEMTIFVVQELKTALEEPLANNYEIEFDLSKVTEIDGAGMQIMLMAKTASMSRGIELRFIGHSEAVREMLDLTDLGLFFGDPIVIEAQQ